MSERTREDPGLREYAQTPASLENPGLPKNRARSFLPRIRTFVDTIVAMIGVGEIAGTESGLTPQPAAVVPRVRRGDSQAGLPIDRLLLLMLRERITTGLVVIVAPPGGGKTTALRHLSAVLPADGPIQLFDADQSGAAQRAAWKNLAVLAVSEPSPNYRYLEEVLRLCPWTLDDCLEYLLARHPQQCHSVLTRLKDDASLAGLAGLPQFLALAMDAMAHDPSLMEARDAVRHHVWQLLPPGVTLNRLVAEGDGRGSLTIEQRRWWRHPEVKRIATADWIAGQLCLGQTPKRMCNLSLVGDIAALVRHQPAAIETLSRLLERDGRSSAAPMAASILLAVDEKWRPVSGRGLNLTNALLAGASWAGIDLTGTILHGAYLKGADLVGANLSNVNATSANFSGANLRGARLAESVFQEANFAEADLSTASGANTNFSGAVLERANLSDVALHVATFAETDLSGVQAEMGDFSGSGFVSAKIESADFSGANLTGTDWLEVDMSQSNWRGAKFRKAHFRGCSLEGLIIPEADFDEADLTGCLLTGSVMPGGSFRDANLTLTGLADIDWENADLRNADFTAASFHMGSTRSGLVGSTIPCEGSRTGFYTDDFDDQSYKRPEEIRKASLCGANLPGAQVEKADFYLVDLRYATYSDDQAQHFSKSGAILYDRE
jgi:uncharacterized protein YjbI with pentapeptide repeats